MEVTLIIFGTIVLIKIFIDTFGYWMDNRDRKKRENSYKAYDIYQKTIYNNEGNPFKKNKELKVQIIDIQRNCFNVLWIKFRYLTEDRYVEDKIIEDGKIKNEFECKESDFHKKFPNKVE